MTTRSTPAPSDGPATSESPPLVEVLRLHRDEILARWIELQSEAGEFQAATTVRGDLTRSSTEILDSLIAALDESTQLLGGPQRDRLVGLLAELSRDRALQGYSPSETASSVFSIKSAVQPFLQTSLSGEQLLGSLVTLNDVIDALGLVTFEQFVKGREAVIVGQTEQLLELSTPVVKIWDGVVALPLIGTLDSARTQVVMETLLQTIVDTDASVAIIDITGVPTVDTLVAQHLLKTVAAARLMGADCIISGIRPQIAQTIVHLGLELGDVTTKATLADALRLAMAHVNAGPPTP